MLRHRVLAVSVAAPGDWSCVPSAAHPRPVVRVHGTFENRWNNWQALSNGLFLLPGSDDFAASCPACRQQQAGSPFLQQLDAGGDTVAGVTYTVIQTRHDEVVTPYASAFLSGPDVTNILLQDQDPANRAEHVTIPYDPLALADVLAALR
jgi:hypothetical protein